MEKAEAIVGLLQAEWDATNTGGVTPEIGLVYDYKSVNVAWKDWVLVYSVDEGHSAFGIGARDWLEEGRVSIDWRTSDRTRHEQIKREILRILRKNVAFGVYRLSIVESERDLSDKTKGLYRGVIDVRLSRIVTI